LKRIDEDEFGFCDDCGDKIGQSRLMANPVITKCTSCIRGE